VCPRRAEWRSERIGVGSPRHDRKGAIGMTIATFLVACLLTATAPRVSHPLLIQAHQAHAKPDLVAETSILRKLAESGAPADARAAALRRLANLKWRFDAQPDAARKILDQAEALPAGKFETLIELARMERSTKRLVAAETAARSALELAGDAQQETTA